MDKSLYFIAYIPSPPLSEEIEEIKNHVSKKHQVYAALKSPPHLTLQAPFRIDSKYEKNIIELLNQLTSSNATIELVTQDFNYFGNKTVYIQIKKNFPLELLRDELVALLISENILNIHHKDHRNFKPHITIANRDFDEKVFKRIWSEFESKKFQKSMILNNLSLLKHFQNQWEVIHKAIID